MSAETHQIGTLSFILPISLERQWWSRNIRKHKGANGVWDGWKFAPLTYDYFAELPRDSRKHPNVICWMLCICRVCVHVYAHAYVRVSTCVCIWTERWNVEGGEKRGMKMEQMDERRSAKEDYATSNHHCTHKISPPTLLQRLQSQCRAGII